MWASTTYNWQEKSVPPLDSHPIWDYLGNVKNENRFPWCLSLLMGFFLSLSETIKTDNVSSVLPMSEEEIVKEKIFGVCRERFLREGFAHLTVDELAADLGISKKTYYKHFASKEDLVQRILDRTMATIRGKVEQILIGDASAVEKFTRIIRLIATEASQLLPAFGRDIQKRMPHLWKEIEEFRRERISEIFARLTVQGVKEGTMREDLNPRMFLLCILGSIERIVQPQVLAHESFSVGDAVNGILGIFFQGGLTETGRQQFSQLQKSSS
jgi:AcrR family transcriptional regulator